MTTSITPEQRRAVREKAEQLGFSSDVAFRIGLNLTDSNIDLNQSGSDLLLGAFRWDESPEGHRFWYGIYKEQIDKEEHHSFLSEPVEPVNDSQVFTQAEKQQLLHILRNDLDCASFHKRMHKEDAADLWQDCDKDNSDDPYTAKVFQHFSDTNHMYKHWSKREKMLVNLITKLKRGAK